MSRQITQKIIQSLVRIETRTRSQRLCGGNRLRRLTREQTGLIEIQTLFQLQIGMSAHETLDKPLTEPVSPF